MGAAIAAIGAVASLGEMGYGLYQNHKTKQAWEKSVAEAKAAGKPGNAFASRRCRGRRASMLGLGSGRTL